MTQKRRLISIGVSAALALAFALVFYAFNTPLGPSIGSDNAMYLTLGTALDAGYAPYTEIFDHKGPLLYLLQWLPQAVSGGYSTLAVFVQQAIFLLMCLRVLCLIARELHAPEIPVQLCYLALICSLAGGGNLTEEYANLFTLIGLYAAVRVFSRGLPESGRGLFAPSALMGAMAALAFLTRANNALPLCALAFGPAVSLLATRRFAPLGRCALGCVCGAAAAALPVCAWLISEGALGEAVYGSIIHNMMYSKTGGGSRLDMLLHSGYGHCALVMLALSLGGAAVFFFYRRSRALGAALAACAAGGFMAGFISHKFYDHYLITGAPCAALGAAAMLGALRDAAQRERMRRIAAVIAAAACLVWLVPNAKKTNDWRLSERAGWDQFVSDAQALYAQVPQEDRDSFMAYRVEPKWYVACEALPCMRFYFLQETLADADPAVMDEIVDAFENDPPKWLVIYYNREFGPPYDARVAEIFENDYAFVDARGTYQLRRYVGKEGA